MTHGRRNRSLPRLSHLVPGSGLDSPPGGTLPLLVLHGGPGLPHDYLSDLEPDPGAVHRGLRGIRHDRCRGEPPAGRHVGSELKERSRGADDAAEAPGPRLLSWASQIDEVTLEQAQKLARLPIEV
jgi:hypothetical protein